MVSIQTNTHFVHFLIKKSDLNPDIKADLFPKIKHGIYDAISFNRFKSTLKIIFLLKGCFLF